MSHTNTAADPRVYFALTYARLGWPVFVLGRSKRPLANCRDCQGQRPDHGCDCLTCHGFYAATLNPRRLEAMLATTPTGLLAIRTGAVSGLVVIDIDPRHGGTLNRDSMTRTAFVATAGGGLHLYYRYPGLPHPRYPDLPHEARIPSRPLPGAVGVDVKAEGGYVVAPPSRLAPGREYLWAGSVPSGPGLITAVNEMAPALAARCRPDPADPPTGDGASTPAPGRPHGPGDALSGAGAISSPDALLDAILKAVHDAPKGRHRVTLYGAARGVARMVAAGALTPATAWAELWTTGKAVGQTTREAREAILGGFLAEGVPITPPTEAARGAA